MTAAADRRPGKGAIGGLALLVVWAVLVLVFFVVNLCALFEPALGLARILALMGLSLYSFCFLGWRVRRGFRFFSPEGLEPLERSLVEFALGVGAVIAALFAAGICGLYRPLTAWLVIGLPLVGNHVAFLRDLRKRWRASRTAAGPSILGIYLLVVAVLTLLQSLAPAVSQDALVYHLAVPARYIEEGRMHYVEGNFYSAFPMNVEMLFTLGLLLEGETLAKWYHWMLGAASVLAVAALARRLAAGSRGRGGFPALMASALFGTIPTVCLIAGWAYVDLGVVFFSTLSLLLFLRFWSSQHGVDVPGLRHESTPYLVLAAVAAGLAAGCKYTAGFQGILVAGSVGVLGLRGRRAARVVSLQLLLTCLILAATAGPWIVKNLATTGNPVFPFGYSLFGGEDWDASRAAVLSLSLSEWGGDRTGWELLRLPWDVSVSGAFFSQEQFDGVIGCAFLIGAPLLLLGLRRSPEYRIASLFFLLNGALWIATTHQVRFLLPAVAIASALLAAAVEELGAGWRRRAPEHMLQAAMFCNLVLVVIHFAAHNPLPVVLGYESEHRYRRREVPGGDYAVFHYIERELPGDSRILFGSCGNPGFLCKRSYYSDALFENFTLDRFLRESRTPEALSRRLADEGFTHLLFRFDCVFDPSGRKSELSLESQRLLAEFLNHRAQLESRAGPTFLYRLEPGGRDDDDKGEERP